MFADADFLLLVAFVGGCSTCLSVAVRSGFGLGAGLGVVWVSDAFGDWFVWFAC